MNTNTDSVVKKIYLRLPPVLQRIIRRARLNYQGAILLAATLVGGVPSHHFRRFMYRHVFGIRLGKGTIVHWQTRFFGPSGIQIGDYCNIGNSAFLDGRRGLIIGNYVATASEVMIYTLQHDIDSPRFDVVGGPVLIDDYVYIGPRAIVLPGVHIGRGVQSLPVRWSPRTCRRMHSLAAYRPDSYASADMT